MKWKFIAAIMAVIVIFGCGGVVEPYVPNGAGTGTYIGFFLTGSGTQTISSVGPAEYAVTVNLGTQEQAKPASSREIHPVALSITGLPAGVTSSFASNNILPTTPGTRVDFSVPVDTFVSPGSYPFSVVGTDGVQTRTQATYTLNIGTGGD